MKRLLGVLALGGALVSVALLPSASSGAAKLTIAAPTKCGNDQVVKNSDPDGVLKALPATTRASYSNWPWSVAGTPWTKFKGKKGPWKIAFISFPVDNPWQVNLFSQLKKEFAKAKAKGLVTGSLQTYVQPSWSTATPQQQISAIQTMVDKGVDGIIIHPLDTLAETPAIDAAGKAGVPVVITADVADKSTYALNVFGVNISPMIAGTLKLAVQKGLIAKNKTTNVLRVRGTAGPANEKAFQEAGDRLLSACPGIKTVGTVYGNWNAAAAKAAVLKWFASHPGTKVDLVVQNGAMEAGIIQAFEQVGKPVPPMNFSGSSGGDFAWWAAHAKDYYALGGQYTGAQTAVATMRVLLRTLAGNGPKLRDLSLPAEVVTSSNVKQFAAVGKPVTFVGDTGGPVSRWGSNAHLDPLFVKSGTPGGL
jgi:ribose transport system substrate-binding protein